MHRGTMVRSAGLGITARAGGQGPHGERIYRQGVPARVSRLRAAAPRVRDLQEGFGAAIGPTPGHSETGLCPGRAGSGLWWSDARGLDPFDVRPGRARRDWTKKCGASRWEDRLSAVVVRCLVARNCALDRSGAGDGDLLGGGEGRRVAEAVHGLRLDCPGHGSRPIRHPGRRRMCNASDS